MELNLRGEVFQNVQCPLMGPFNIQRFKQWSPEDLANFYIATDENSKKPLALYPTMGRSHIIYAGLNQLQFSSEPRGIFKSINYAYVVDGNTIYRVDSNYNLVNISGTVLQTNSGVIYFDFLVVNTIVFAVFSDTQKVYVYQEDSGSLEVITDPNCPGNFTIDGKLTKPGYIKSFGNRIVVSVSESSQFVLSAINLGGIPFNPATCFTVNGAQVFAQEEGIIRQFAVLNNTLYIFTDYITGIWSNAPAIFNVTQTTFPWTKNTTYDWNFGIANPTSLDVDFGLIVFLAQNKDGLLQFMVSDGGNQPQKISTKPVDTLLQRYTNLYGINNPFLVSNSNGFLYQYENSIFYRMSGGNYYNYGILDDQQNANCIEFNFESKKWHRSIELNGERNRIQQHIYFNFKHLVTVVDDNTVYNMSGQYYYNELRNTDQADGQATDSYIAYPFRYENVSEIIFMSDYSEHETEYVQVDMVWGDRNINYSLAPFGNTKFIIDEDTSTGNKYIIAENPDNDGNPIFIIGEIGNTPSVDDLTYNYLYKPHIELFFSDDGGISFLSADVREFSQMGLYSWRMRWYQLGPSRNRVYKLIAVSPVPIVILGATMSVRRISGGAS